MERQSLDVINRVVCLACLATSTLFIVLGTIVYIPHITTKTGYAAKQHLADYMNASPLRQWGKRVTSPDYNSEEDQEMRPSLAQLSGDGRFHAEDFAYKHVKFSWSQGGLVYCFQSLKPVASPSTGKLHLPRIYWRPWVSAKPCVLDAEEEYTNSNTE